jgi:carbonic anhydrase/acetyltransferase-like protein (isoleucine patch superfamily)
MALPAGAEFAAFEQSCDTSVHAAHSHYTVRLRFIVRPWEAGMIRTFRGRTPQIASSAYVDPQAIVIGDVVIGEESSVWPCAVLRADYNSIRIGARSSVQDNSVFHIEGGQYALTVGSNVTIGHRVILHGCTVESDCLIGMGSILLNGCKIGAGSLIAAGTLITEGTEIPPGSLVMGAPGKIRRLVNDAERQFIARSADHYVTFTRDFRAENYRG